MDTTIMDTTSPDTTSMDTVSPQQSPLQHPDPLPIPQTNLANTIAIASLALLTWSTLTEIRNYEHGVDFVVGLILLGVTVAAWLTWVLVRGRIGWATAPVLIILSLAGGALAAFAPTAMIFTAVATLGAATAWRIQVAIAIGAGGWLAMVIAVWGAGKAWAIALGGLAAILAGALVGFTRRQIVERTHQAAQVEVETARAEVERARAELLGRAQPPRPRNPRRAGPHPGCALAAARGLCHRGRRRARDESGRAGAAGEDPAAGARGPQRGPGCGAGAARRCRAARRSAAAVGRPPSSRVHGVGTAPARSRLRLS